MIKCNFKEEPTGYLRDANVTKNLDSFIRDFNYTCNTFFNYTNDQPPFDADKECIVDNENPYSWGASGCKGEVFDQDFWTTRQKIPFQDHFTGLNDVYNWIQDFEYQHRHNVLFNLYAFDTYRSNRTHSPTLNLIDCDFEYFFDK